MEDINALPVVAHGISLFSGCGGSSLGYRMAGIKMMYANEFVPHAAKTYRSNFPGTAVDTRDIRLVKPEEILDLCYLRKGEMEFLDGSPPCCSFSSCGNGPEMWGKVKKYSSGIHQRTDDLFNEFIRILDGIQPKVFVAENTYWMTRGVNKGVLKGFWKSLEACGYTLDSEILNAKSFGVPQHRPRLFIMGVRNDLNLKPIFPKADSGMPLVSLNEALDGVQHTSQVEEPEAWNINPENIAMWHTLKPGEFHPTSFNLRRSDWNEPCHTILQSGGEKFFKTVMHPDEPRKYYTRELKRICSFPDDFILEGKYQEKYERLGRAVPPLLSKNLGLSVLSVLREVTHQSCTI